LYEIEDKLSMISSDGLYSINLFILSYIYFTMLHPSERAVFYRIGAFCIEQLEVMYTKIYSAIALEEENKELSGEKYYLNLILGLALKIYSNDDSYNNVSITPQQLNYIFPTLNKARFCQLNDNYAICIFFLKHYLPTIEGISPRCLEHYNLYITTLVNNVLNRGFKNNDLNNDEELRYEQELMDGLERL
jgi:hypothetical protein